MDNEIAVLKNIISQQQNKIHDLEQNLETTQQKLDNLNFYLNNILLSLPEHIYWMDTNEVVLGCNDKQAKSFGLNDKSELIGKSLQQIGQQVGWEQSMIDAIHKNNMEIIRTGKSIKVEEDAIFHGDLRTHLSYKSPLIDNDNKVIGILGITVDITERKRMERDLLEAKEKAESANKAKSEFIMNMSHDIRTPLNGMVGFAEILKMREADSEKREYLDYIYDSSMSLFSLFNEIMELVKIEAGEIINVNKKFSLRKIIEDIISLMKIEAIRKNISMTATISDSLPEFMFGDKLKVHRILLNLLGNALKFTEKGNIEIQAEVINKDDNVVKIKLAIKDTGIGMPNDKLEAIFERFTRLDIADRSLHKGIGLGLYIVKKFVDDLQGSIDVKSQQGVGTIFTCILDFSCKAE